ncbi:hypothetical protein ACVWWN_004882 [Mycobacterium sp. URHB0021]
MFSRSHRANYTVDLAVPVQIPPQNLILPGHPRPPAIFGASPTLPAISQRPGRFPETSGRHDDPAVYGGPGGDQGLIGPGSVSWEVNADLAAVSQAGLPAIVLESLQPSVIAGVQEMSNYWALHHLTSRFRPPNPELGNDAELRRFTQRC